MYMDTNQILEIVIILLGVFLAFFVSYLSERGKQVALKKDIEELTRKVEKIKSKIDLETKTKFELGMSKKNAILEFVPAFVSWRNEVIYLSPTAINLENYMNPRILFDEHINKHRLFDIASTNLSIFLEDSDQEIRDSIRDTVLLCIEIEALSQKICYTVAAEYNKRDYAIKNKGPSRRNDIQIKFQETITKLNDAFCDRRHEMATDLFKIERMMNVLLQGLLFTLVDSKE